MTESRKHAADIDKAGRKLPISNLFKTPTAFDTLHRYIKTVKLDSLDRLRRHFDGLTENHWIFRGQSDSRWHLTTSLERAVKRDRPDIAHVESHLISSFKARAHLYASDVPGLAEDLEWVALMQHYGCPTRLLDFTRSPYIALYFAVETAPGNGSCAVWAVNSHACDERAVHRIQHLQEWAREPVLEDDEFYEANVAGRLGLAGLFRKAFLSNQFQIVCTVEPVRHNNRVALQQGCFLCPGDISTLNGFESNLFYQIIMGNDPEYFFPVWNPPQIFRFVIPGRLRAEMLHELKRMNISRASLFPGLDGFAKSLRFNLDLAREAKRPPSPSG